MPYLETVRTENLNGLMRAYVALNLDSGSGNSDKDLLEVCVEGVLKDTGRLDAARAEIQAQLAGKK